MFTVGLGLFGAALVSFIYKQNAPSVLEGFASVRPCWPCSCASGAASSPRPRTWGADLSEG